MVHGPGVQHGALGFTESEVAKDVARKLSNAFGAGMRAKARHLRQALEIDDV